MKVKKAQNVWLSLILIRICVTNKTREISDPIKMIKRPIQTYCRPNKLSNNNNKINKLNKSL